MIPRALVACLLLIFTGVYRFNTLGGSLGGFDNDHFVSFAYAKQVQAGEQPLQDFAGLNLQGAWPSLTYEISAFAQQRFGDNLRSEAIIAVAGVSLAAAFTFLTASLLAPIGWAALATVLSVFMAPTLYNYPKVLVLSAASLLMVLYAQRPSPRAIAVSALLTAAAFLFRHDLAVYAAVGTLMACVAAERSVRALTTVALYVALTLALLAPSLWYVHRHEGLVRYVQAGMDMSRREVARTDLEEWPQFTVPTAGLDVAGFFNVEANSLAWLYYMAHLLPFAVGFAVWRGTLESGRPAAGRAALAIAGMTAFSVPLLVRNNPAVRLADVGPLVAVGTAVACHALWRRRAGEARWGRVIRPALLVVLLAGTVLSTTAVGVVQHQLAVSGLTESPVRVGRRTAHVWDELGALPAESLVQPVSEGPLAVSQYLNACTAPADRVVMMAYQPDILPLAGRMFGAGRLSIIPGFALLEYHQRELVGWWRQQRVPVVLVEYQELSEPGSSTAPIVTEYLLANYKPIGAFTLSGDRTLQVFGRQDAQMGVRRSDGLPCLR